ncbi:hypothetical protein PCANC_16105 [Puccinia coronata f. sp. avenae]|uniref:Uncharacterized protein n=1 Tax=Puccinia coronata f. sp. avenae TaxID=200324 RepID=A0A2N5UE61_9BASI|nr:hypothetical protein PCANC_16105 [Puccinia coronata f. sp. avenae]
MEADVRKVQLATTAHCSAGTREIIADHEENPMCFEGRRGPLRGGAKRPRSPNKAPRAARPRDLLSSNKFDEGLAAGFDTIPALGFEHPHGMSWHIIPQTSRGTTPVPE